MNNKTHTHTHTFTTFATKKKNEKSRKRYSGWAFFAVDFVELCWANIWKEKRQRMIVQIQTNDSITCAKILIGILQTRQMGPYNFVRRYFYWLLYSGGSIRFSWTTENRMQSKSKFTTFVWQHIQKKNYYQQTRLPFSHAWRFENEHGKLWSSANASAHWFCILLLVLNCVRRKHKSVDFDSGISWSNNDFGQFICRSLYFISCSRAFARPLSPSLGLLWFVCYFWMSFTA